MDEQPELDLGEYTQPSPRWRRGKAKPAPKPADGAVKWSRVHTLERCHECISTQQQRLDGADGSPHVAWPASYVRTEKGTRVALCYLHAAPRREAEGLRPQRKG
jgi:hypothetical protein